MRDGERFSGLETVTIVSQAQEVPNSLIFSRHLDDVDDLALYGLDAPLIESQENFAKIAPSVDAVYQRIQQNHKKAVLLISSSKLRALQPAEIIASRLKSLDKSLHVRFAVDENFKATEQGAFVVSPEYIPGDKHKGLTLAGQIYTKETHASFYDSEAIDNIDYKFGDPFLLPDSSFKYPELLPHFTEPGETHREGLLQIFTSVIAAGKKYKKFFKSTEVVLVGHGQTFQLLRGLSMLGEQTKTRKITFKAGDSVKFLWEIYVNCSDELKIPGICVPIETELLNNDKMMAILQSEINYLENSKGW